MAGWLSAADPNLERDAEAAASTSDFNPEKLHTPFWEGTGKGIGAGLMRGGAKAADLIQTLGSFYDEPANNTQQVDALADDIRKSSIDYWTPNAREVGTAGRVLGGVSEMVLPLMATAGDPAVFVGSQTLATGKDLIDQGVDATTAGDVAAIEGAANYAGFRIPFFGNTLARRMASGVVGNLATNTAGAAAQNTILDAAGYEQQAAQFDPLNLENRAIDVIAGAAFGGAAHIGAKFPTAHTDAALTATNARHFQEETAPGSIEDTTTAAAHQSAMDKALHDLETGNEVDVAAHAMQMRIRPDAAISEGIRQRSEAIQRAADDLVSEIADVLDSTDAPARAAPAIELRRDIASEGDPLIAHARSTAAAQPDMQIVLPDADGAPRALTAAQALNEADAAIAEAQKMPTVFEAAINCFLRG